MMGHYILDDDRNVVLIEVWKDGRIILSALTQWARWFEDDSNRRVARTEFEGGHVSTVFLGLDRNFMGEGPPMVFETMVFGGALAGEEEQCATWVEAEEMHKRMVRRAS